jgi:hypothetical protein
MVKSMQFFEKCLCCFKKPSPPAKKLTRQASIVSTASTLSPRSASTASRSELKELVKTPKPANAAQLIAITPRQLKNIQHSHDDYDGELPEIGLLFPVPKEKLSKTHLQKIIEKAEINETLSDSQVQSREKYLQESLEMAHQISAIAETNKMQNRDLEKQIEASDAVNKEFFRNQSKPEYFYSAMDQTQAMLVTAIRIAKACKTKLP